MGLRIRKSVNLGAGFRINVSKTGVGYSWGTKGYRVTKTAKGTKRTTYSIPGTGVSYVDERQKTKENSTLINASVETASESSPLNADSSQDPISKSIERGILLNKIGLFFLLGVLLIKTHILFISIPLIGVLLIILAHTAAKTVLNYSLDSEKEAAYNKMLSAWQLLSESNKHSQVISKCSLDTAPDGSTIYGLTECACHINSSIPFYIKSNVAIIHLKLSRKQRLLLLPDRGFLIRKGRVKTIDYSDLDIVIAPMKFTESGTLPSDALVLDYTWQHTNKNGTPDKRYRNNQALPVCLYGNLMLKNSNGFYVELLISNLQKATQFSELMAEATKAL